MKQRIERRRYAMHRKITPGIAYSMELPAHQLANIETLTGADQFAPVQGPWVATEVLERDERTETDGWLATAGIDTEKRDLGNIDTTGVDLRFLNARAAARWAWGSLKILPHIPELGMVRESILRDLTYTASANMDWTEKKLRQLARQIGNAARMNDGTEIALEQVRDLEEQIEAHQRQLDDWTDLHRGFASAHKLYLNRVDRGAEMPDAWGPMPRARRQERVRDWAIELRSTFDASDELRDRLHERLYWNLCNIAWRNARWCEKGHAEEQRPEMLRRWKLQLEAWNALLPAFEAAYRMAAPGHVFVPRAAKPIDRVDQVRDVATWTAAQYQRRYGVLPEMKASRANSYREQMRREAAA
jgi:hypothetical protein